MSHDRADIEAVPEWPEVAEMHGGFFTRKGDRRFAVRGVNRKEATEALAEHVERHA